MFFIKLPFSLVLDLNNIAIVYFIWKNMLDSYSLMFNVNFINLKYLLDTRPNFECKYFKHTKSCPDLSASKFNFFKNLELCEWTELESLNLLSFTSNAYKVLHINL